MENFINKVINADAVEGLKMIPDKSVDMCWTSPPYYGLRNYGHKKQIGLERTPEEYVSALVKVFTEVNRVLKDCGTLWLNIGDSYAGSGKAKGDRTISSYKQGTNRYSKHSESLNSYFKNDLYKPKDLIGIPWMVAFALRSAGWYLRQDIIWNKPNPMPESVTDRCTKSHEYLFLLSKSRKYFFDAQSIKTLSLDPVDDRGSRGNKKRTPNKLVNGIRSSGVYEFANKRSVWTIPTKPFNDAHFATAPEELLIDCIKAGCPEGGIVIDPFMGALTTGIVAKKLNRNFIGIELNPDYIKIGEKRATMELGLFK